MNKIMQIVIILLVAAASLFILTGCNKQILDTTYTYNKAIIIMNDGSRIEVDIKKWNDYDGEQLQIVAKDGTVYLVSSYNTILIKE